ncbi:putative RNA-directed RNA polymerase [Rhizophagus irregularis DAOM 181602=DAOM 197198]|nr:putative RNA-directed RNA polymerase [Rhizophagus irregularis DAOM 181602=DAOM 197198]
MSATNVKDNQVQVRPSQHKFESHHNVLEVNRGSTFISAYLNHLRVRELDKMLDGEHTALDKGMLMNMEFQSHLLILPKRDFYRYFDEFDFIISYHDVKRHQEKGKNSR